MSTEGFKPTEAQRAAFHSIIDLLGEQPGEDVDIIAHLETFNLSPHELGQLYATMSLVMLSVNTQEVGFSPAPVGLSSQGRRELRRVHTAPIIHHAPGTQNLSGRHSDFEHGTPGYRNTGRNHTGKSRSRR